MGELCDPPIPQDQLKERETWYYHPDERVALKDFIGADQDLDNILDKLHRHPSYPHLHRAFARCREACPGAADGIYFTDHSYQDHLTELYKTRFRRPWTTPDR